MADVTVSYKGNTIAEMSAEGTKILNTSGKYCEGNITVSYVPPTPEAVGTNYKIFDYKSAAAVANVDVTIVSGDPDVAKHYADENAMVTVRKVSNNDTRGIVFMMNGNRSISSAYGVYGNYNLSTLNASVMNIPLTAAAHSGALPTLRCNANGDIILHCINMQNNFGGADYIITFSW